MMREPLFSLLPRPAPAKLAGKRVLVLGLGDTGLSVANWVVREGGTARVADTRDSPPRKKDFPGELQTGPFGPALLKDVDLVCISPGLSIAEPIVKHALARGVPVLGDVELFAWQVRAAGPSRVLAVTGTNGKSTVAALAAHLLRAAGIDCETAGNIGPPVLETLLKRALPPAVWVLELSSYQLETTWSLAPDAAAMLNLTADHLDRYAGIADYGAAKARVFQGDGVQVLNRDDPRSIALALPGRKRITFGLGEPGAADDFGILRIRDSSWLAQGTNAILEAGALGLHGWHNAQNALAAAALARALGVQYAPIAEGWRNFKGLPHRLQRLATRRGVDWYDDSKGTNVGATVAALKGLNRGVVLIAGGDGKGQDFSPLRESVVQFARAVLLIGRDAPRIEQALAGIAVQRCATLEDAVRRASRIAKPGDAVLLSPACASFDMFRDYRHRGEAFAAAVEALGG